MANQYSRDPDTFWTDKREDELRQLHAEGLSYRQIADKLGTTKNSVTGKANRIGLRRRDAYPRLTARRAREAAWDRAQAEAQKARNTSPTLAQGPLIQGGIVFAADGVRYERTRREPSALPACEEIEGGVTFAEIRANQCRWIPGETNGLDTIMCGRPALLGKSYCPACYARLFSDWQPRLVRRAA